MPLTPEEKKSYLVNKGLNPDEYDVEEIGVPDSAVAQPPQSPLETFGKSALRALIPSGGAMGGMRAGAMLPLPHPLLKGAAILGGGVLGSLGSSWLQEKALKAVESPESYNQGVQDLEAGRQQNPKSAFLGEMAPNSLAFGPGGLIGEASKIFTPATISRRVLANAGLMGGVNAAMEGGREAISGEDISPGKIAGVGLVGGLLQNSPTKLGERILGPSFRPPVLAEPEVIASQNKSVTPKAPVLEDIPSPVAEKQQQQEGIENLRKELQGREVTPSLQTDKSPDVIRGEPENRVGTEEGINPDPTEKFYQEEEGIKRSVKAPALGGPSNGNSGEPIISLHDVGDYRTIKDREAVKKGQMFVKNGPQYDPITKERILSEAGPGEQLTPEQLTQANELASKRGVTLQQEPGIISSETNQEARGYAIPDERIARINPNTATSDTGIHEVGHNYLRDLRDSSNPRDREFFNRGVKAAGSEEKLTEAMGKRVSDIENRPLRTWLEDSANYLGSKVGLTEENTSNALARRLRDDRPFNESPEFQKAVGEVNKYYSESGGSSSGTTNQIPQTKDRSITTGPLKSVVDSIAEHSPVAAKAVESTSREASRLNGKITNSFIEAASKIKDKVNAVKYIWESRYNEDGKSSTVPLNPKDKALIDGPINETYKQVHEEQRANGPLINGREAIDNPNLKGPNIISQSVLDTILHKPAASAERKKLINDFIEHQIKHGEAADEVEAKRNFNELLRGFSAGGEKNKTASFNALRKAEGFGIPFSWMEKDPVKLFQRYGNKVARDLAYYRNIESNPEVSALFGHTSKEGVEPVTGQAIQTAQNKLTGQHTTSETLYSSIEHFVRSLILGPATGVKNTVSTLAQILPYTPVRDIPKIAEAFGRIKQGFADSMKLGVNRHSITGLETGDVTGLGRVAENLRSMGDIIRKYTGANAIEQWTRAHNMALGEILTEANWGRASKGDIEARKFLRMFAPEGESLDFRKLGELPDSVKLETAARFVERIQGTYDLRGLPSFLLEPSSPAYWFMSLSKWSVEKANVITKDVINPVLNGQDYGPLLRYTLGGLVTGEVIREIGAALNSKKPNTPDIKEIQDKGKISDWIYKGFELSNLSGLGGLYSDLAKMSGDLVKGYNSKGYTIPSYELAKDLTTEIGNASQAIAEGQHPIDVIQNLALNLITDNVQAIRLVSNQLNTQETDRVDKFRDKRIYDKLDGKNVPPPQGRTDRYTSMAEREFKRAKTPEEGKEILEDKIKPKLAEESKEDRKKSVSRLKENNYQTVPADRKEAEKYYQYIRRTQGVDAMMRLKKDKGEQDRVNKIKERMVR